MTMEQVHIYILNFGRIQNSYFEKTFKYKNEITNEKNNRYKFVILYKFSNENLPPITKYTAKIKLITILFFLKSKNNLKIISSTSGASTTTFKNVKY